jgi:hypothetical protein
MKKLSKKERHDIYISALNLTKIHKHESVTGMCALFSRRLNVNVYYDYKRDKPNFPEFSSFITEEYPDLNWNERELILMFCIEMTR